MAQKENRFRINNGPSKFDLMVSLFGGNALDDRTVKMSFFDHSLFSQHNDVTFSIIEIEREDGSRESWMFKAYLNGRPVEGYYSSQTRQGHFDLSS